MVDLALVPYIYIYIYIYIPHSCSLGGIPSIIANQEQTAICVPHCHANFSNQLTAALLEEPPWHRFVHGIRGLTCEFGSTYVTVRHVSVHRYLVLPSTFLGIETWRNWHLLYNLLYRKFDFQGIFQNALFLRSCRSIAHHRTRVKKPRRGCPSSWLRYLDPYRDRWDNPCLPTLAIVCC